MFQNVTPENIGLESKCVRKFIEHIEDCGLTTHDIVMMRGENIFCEAYWKPFDKDFKHRQYSQTKSFVGIAIGLLEEEGKLKLTDKIVDYFPDKIDRDLPEYLKVQTIEDMLTMRTSVSAKKWFGCAERDRVRNYFNVSDVPRPAGTTWQYDSPGSQVLCVLVERLAGKPLLEYMKDRLFNKMGTFQGARILKTPTGDSWGDSALLCTPRDMLSFARLLLNGGVWKGERLMNESYIQKATSAVVSNVQCGHIDAHHTGYGYQIWRIEEDAFAFVGMGQQLTVCYPKYDLIFVCNSDNQGGYYPYDLMLKLFRYDVLENLQASPLPANERENTRLNEYLNSLTLRAVKGIENDELMKKINGKKFVAVGQNKQGMVAFTFHFEGEKGKLCYTNAQGDKELFFGVNKNVFGKFPQLGYSNEYGGVETTDGFTYDCAASLAFKDDDQLLLYVQIIDIYFGNMSMIVGVNGEYANVHMVRAAENFLDEYVGDFVAKME